VTILKTEIAALKQQHAAYQHEIRTKDDRIDQFIREIRNLVSIDFTSNLTFRCHSWCDEQFLLCYAITFIKDTYSCLLLYSSMTGIKKKFVNNISIFQKTMFFIISR